MAPPPRRPSGSADAQHTPHSRGRLATAIAVLASAVLGAALLGLYLIRNDWSHGAAQLGPWLAAAGFMLGVGITLLAVALSMRRLRDGTGASVRRSAWLSAPAAVVMLVGAITLLGGVTFKLGSNLVERASMHRLETAAQLKEALIETWFEDAHEDLRLWAGSGGFTRMLDDWRDGHDGNDARTALLGYLWERALTSHYLEIALCRTGCAEPLLAVTDPDGRARRAGTLAAGHAALHERQPANATGLQSPAPVYLSQSLAGGAEALYLRVGIDPRHDLFRLVQHWPGEATSSEMLLAQPEGDALVVLSNTPSGPGETRRRLVADIPGLVAGTTWPSAGRSLPTGLSENGRPQMAWAVPVSNTRWLLVTKLDRAEAFAELHRVFGVAAALTVVILLAGVWWTLEHRRHASTAQALLQERAAQAQRVADLSRRVVSAQEEERRHMAAELHDQSGANLAAIQMNLKAIERRMAGNDEDDHDLIRETSALLAATVVQIREFCAELRPATLDYAGPVEAIGAAALRLKRRSGFEVDVDCANYRVRQPAEVEAVLFRLAQETLLNCAKHSKAKRVSIRLEAPAEGRVRLEITDDGVGFDLAALGRTDISTGHGLLIMRERAQFAQGRLSIDSAPDRGTRVVFEQC